MSFVSILRRRVPAASLVAISLLVSAPLALGQVVISQVYGGGGNAGAPRTHDFIELFNAGPAAQSLGGKSVAYASAAGNTWNNLTVLPSVMLQPGEYFLIQQASGGAAGVALPTPDATGVINMSGTNGKVILVDGTTQIANATCPVGAIILDVVGFGSANCPVAPNAPAGVLSNTTAALRNGNGCTNTGNNSTDFTVGTPAPRNTSTPDAPCVADFAPTVTSTSPGPSATSVALNANIQITFGEAVGTTGAWFAISCATSGAHAATASGGPTVFTLDPDADFVNGELCTVTIENTLIADQDSIDPPDTMAADHVFTFTTLSAAPSLAVADASILESNAGTTLQFQVQLTNAASGSFSVQFDTSDGSATQPGDYTQTNLVLNFDGTAGEIEFANVPIVGDVDPELDENFTVTLSNVIGASVTITDATATGTILNDDIDSISSIQGNGAVSPRDGETILTRGIVTGVRSNSFYIQSQAADADADPNTSEGIYVFVGAGNVPVGLAVGDLVMVSAVVDEFVPTADPNQLPITELVNPVTVTTLSPGNPLPTPVPLPTPDSNGALDQFEEHEFMRVSIPRLIAVSGTNDFSDEFFGVFEGTPRPFREPGVDQHDCGANLPAEAPANVPCWDTNPETIRVKTNLLVGGAAFPVRAGEIYDNIVGLVDPAFRRYTVVTRAAEAPTLVPGTTPMGTPVAAANATEITVGGFNVENLTGITGTTYLRKVGKIVTIVRDFLHYPDILGVIEVANLATLQDVAARINANAAVGSNPNYSAQLLGGASGTQQLGFLVKQALVGSDPRVVVNDLQEFGADLFVTCPDGETLTEPNGFLNDRPPLVMDATITGANGASIDITVIDNHLKSLIDTDSPDDADPLGPYACFNIPGNPGGGEGRRNRAKRQQNAEYLANLVQDLQEADPDRPIILVGDFNAFQFNDGYADLVGTVNGLPSANDTTVVPGDGIDLVNPDLFPLVDLAPASQQYSYVFGGQAQVLDHVIVNQAAIDASTDVRVEYARVNADFNLADAGNSAVPFRSADHDPALAFLDVSAFRSADLALTGGVAPTPIDAGMSTTFSYTLTNNGGDAAINPRVVATVPAGLGFTSHTASAGWSCSAPAAGASGLVDCSIATLANGATADFTVVAQALAASGGTTQTLNVAATTNSTDPSTPNALALDVVVNSQGPTISDVSDQSTAEDGVETVSFTIADPDSTLSCSAPTLSATSGDTNLVPVANIVFGGNVPNCTATITPAANQTGSSLITITVSDGALTASDSFTQTVTAVNDPPQANEDAHVVDEDSGVAIVDVLANDTDAEGDALTVTAVTQPATGGSTSLTGGVVRFTPAANFSGATSFNYTVVDGNGGTDTGLVRVTVNNVNVAPVANNDTLVVVEDSASTSVNVLGNDTDSDGDGLTVTAVTQPASGGSVLLAGGIVSFTPAADFTGTTSFSYTVNDGGLDDTGTVNVTVTPVNDAPVANEDTHVVAEDSGSAIVNVLGNDTDAEGDTLVVTAAFAAEPHLGSVTLVAGVVRFTPVANFNGNTTLIYDISDGNGGVAGASVGVTITPVNDAPTISQMGAITMPENGTGNSGFFLTDDETAVTCADVQVQTDNATLLPVSGITISPELISCDVDVNSVDFETGTATITLTISDGSLSSTDTIQVTVFEDDADNDGDADAVDNCPTTANADQADADGDGIGDVCDPFPNDAVQIFGSGFED